MIELDKKIIEQRVAKRAQAVIEVKAALMNAKGSLIIVYCYNEDIFTLQAKEMDNSPLTYQIVEDGIIETIEKEAGGAPESWEEELEL